VSTVAEKEVWSWTGFRVVSNIDPAEPGTSWLFDQLKTKHNTNAIHKNHALIEQLLIPDFRIYELLDCPPRTNVLNSFRSFFH
jgi:hypothetical protein